jgi:hypothetical protein
MALSGLTLPVGVGPDGRALISTGDVQLIKIIGAHLSFSDSENPFQDIGIDQVIFDINDSRLQPFIRYRLGTLFERLQKEDRARLDVDSILFESDEGELTLGFRYHNLRTNEPVDFRGSIDLLSGRVVPKL